LIWRNAAFAEVADKPDHVASCDVAATDSGVGEAGYMRDNLHRTSYLVVVASLAATPSFAADPDQGETLVKRWCTGCHLVAADQKAATTDAPTFSSIAKRPDFDPTKIEFFLRDPHPKMPNMTLGRAEAADIAAYIGTLR